MEGYVYAQVIVEGPTDIPVVTALMRAAGWADSEFSVTSANGKGVIGRDIKKYWEAARVLPYVIFRDLDQDADGCPVTLRAELVEHIPGESPDLLIRIVDQCIESWMLADRRGIAEFCGVSPARVKIPASHHKWLFIVGCGWRRLGLLRGGAFGVCSWWGCGSLWRCVCLVR